jgi:hypothetical protein
MVLGLTSWLMVSFSISMSAFVEGVLALELPHIYVLFFQTLYLSIFLVHFIIFASPLYKVSSYSIAIWDRVSTERVELKFGLDFVSPFFSIIPFFL